jgi:drug/metabolite transporter (DMT)-like permease
VTMVARLNPDTRPASSRTTNQFALVLALLTIFVVWGTTYLAIRYAVETIPPFVTAAIRHTTAGTILMAGAWARGFRPRKEHWVAGCVVGALFFLIGHGTLHWAEQYVSSGLAALLIASEPMWILVLGAAMGQQRINRLNGTGLLIGLGGVAILSAPALDSQATTAWATVGVLLSAASWSVGVCLSPRLRLPEAALGRAALPMLCGGVMLMLAAAITGELQALSWQAVSLKSMLGLAYLIVFGSILAFAAYTWLLQRVSPTLVATHSYVNPLVAVLVGWWWAAEPLNWRVLAATGVIFAAIVLVQRGERQPAPVPGRTEAS